MNVFTITSIPLLHSPSPTQKPYMLSSSWESPMWCGKKSEDGAKGYGRVSEGEGKGKGEGFLTEEEEEAAGEGKGGIR